MIHTIFNSKERHAAYNRAKARAVAESRRQAKTKGECTFYELVKIASDVNARHRRDLQPPSKPYTNFVDALLQSTDPFWKSTFQKNASHKEMGVFIACIIYYSSLPSGLVCTLYVVY